MPAPPPPPPPIFSSPAAAAGDDGRGALLQSIRSGKALKKTVTNDKSAPSIGGKVKGESSGAPVGSNQSSVSSSNNGNNGAPMGLGGLFSGGMPKLKPTGLRQNITDNSNRTATDTSSTINSVNSSAKPTISVNNTAKTTNSVNNAPKAPAAVPKRALPPVPPPATYKPQIFTPQATSTSVDQSNNESPGRQSFGKPSLAPKPPPPSYPTSAKPSPPPKLNVAGISVSRAQSMRLPRSPPVFTAAPPSLHQSQDCLNEFQQFSKPNRVLRPPADRPPSPPTSRSTATTPRVARVAPMVPSRTNVTAPCMPPPPPPLPHRSAPPVPPVRDASMMRNGQSTNNMLNLETRFAEMFHSISSFPSPETFRAFPKVYNSRNAKQQAPAPPQTSNSSMQLHGSSSGGQWHNAASSAC